MHESDADDTLLCIQMSIGPARRTRIGSIRGNRPGQSVWALSQRAAIHQTLLPSLELRKMYSLQYAE